MAITCASTRILTAQHPLTAAHDEMLFIIQHQTSELWMRLALHELDAARALIAADRLRAGLQDAGPRGADLRAAEFGLGRAAHHDAGRLHAVPRRARPVIGLPVLAIPADRISPSATATWRCCARMRTAPTSWRCSRPNWPAPRFTTRRCARLARAGLPVPAEVLTRDLRQPWVADDRVQAAWETGLPRPRTHWDAYELAEKLVDFEDYFRRWRFNHVTTVERVIGLKRGTGGTLGRVLPAPDAGSRAFPRALAAAHDTLTRTRLCPP